MARTIKFTKMVAKGEGKYPASRIQFDNKSQAVYFALRKLARLEHGTTQTGLARRILTDWVKLQEWEKGKIVKKKQDKAEKKEG